MAQFFHSDLVLEESDVDAMEYVFSYGEELLEADGSDDSVLFAFDPLTTELIRALRNAEPIRVEGLRIAAYCLTLAKEAISGQLAVASDIRSALSPALFDVNRICARLDAVLDGLPKSKHPSKQPKSPTIGFSDNLTFPDEDNWND